MRKFKEVEFGMIPEDWDVKKIIDLKSAEKSAIAMGPFGSNIKAENFVAVGVPVIRGTNFNFDKYIGGEFVFLNDAKADELRGSNCREGDLVFTHRGTIGQVAIIPKGKFSRYVISQSGMKLTVDCEKVNNEFLFYFFKSKAGQYQLLKNEAQVGVPSISNPLTTLKELEVPLPPLFEQLQIVSILNSLDDKIDLLQRQNKILEQLAETLFRQWFVEKAEERWGTLKVKDVCTIISKGTTPTTLGKTFTDSGINFIKAESLTDDGGFLIEKFSHIDEETDEILKRSRISFQDILITIAGTIGRIAYVTQDILPANTNQAIAFMRVKKDLIHPYFIYCLFNTKEIRKDFEGRVVHAVQPNLSLGEIGDIEFRMPSPKILKVGMERILTLFEKKEMNINQIKSLIQLRDTILPKLVRGELRIQNND